MTAFLSFLQVQQIRLKKSIKKVKREEKMQRVKGTNLCPSLQEISDWFQTEQSSRVKHGTHKTLRLRKNEIF